MDPTLRYTRSTKPSSRDESEEEILLKLIHMDQKEDELMQCNVIN